MEFKGSKAGLTDPYRDIVEVLPERKLFSPHLGERSTYDMIYVGPGSIWDMPYTMVMERTHRGKLFDKWYIVSTVDKEVSKYRFNTEAEAREFAVDRYGSMLLDGRMPPFMRTWQEDLEKWRGRDLYCRCLPDQPCHADILLTVANRYDY